MTGGPSHTYWPNPLGCMGHTCCPAQATRLALMFSPTVNMPEGMGYRVEIPAAERVALTLSPTVNMPEGMLRTNDHR
jgi:hypothetical protein